MGKASKQSAKRAAMIAAAAAAALPSLATSTPSEARPDEPAQGPYTTTLTITTGNGHVIPQGAMPRPYTIKEGQEAQRANARAGRFVSGQSSWDEGDESAPASAVPADRIDWDPKG